MCLSFSFSDIYMDAYKVTSSPDSFYYIPNFLDSITEAHLLKKVYEAPRIKWKCLSNRRLQNWGGLPHSRGMVVEDIPHWLRETMNAVQKLGFFGDLTPNHVLVNEYLPGQGILPHSDGPLFHPVVCTISLGSHTLLDLYKREDECSSMTNVQVGTFFLDRLSLFVTTEDGYSAYLHGIAERFSDEITDTVFNKVEFSIGEVIQRQTRVSLTIRHVPKLVNFRLKL